MPKAYYNEIDLYCAEWLYNLQKENLIAPGDIDTRPIQDVCPNDLKGYSQHHFFAGIGGWSRALRLSDWPDHREVWTGSCPCQPFSLAGKRGGFADDRHLWPYFRYLIAIGRPAIVFGEQVASAAEWLGLVRGDLEAMDYAVGAMPVEAASAGADHLRDRFWFVGHDPSDGRSEGRAEHELRGGWPAAPGDGGMEHAAQQQQQHGRRLAGPFGRDEHSDDGSGRLANARRGRRAGSGEGQDQFEGRGEIVGAGSTSNLADYYYSRSQGRPLSAERPDQRFAGTNGVANPDFACEVDGHEQRSGQLGGAGGDPQARDSSVTPNAFVSTDERSITWAEQRLVPSIGGEDASFNWVLGADGKARRVISDFRLLSHGFSTRVGGDGSEQIRASKEAVAIYGQASSQRPAEVLQAVRQRVLSEPAPYETLGEQAGICQAEILLAFLRQLDGSSGESHAPFSSEEEFETSVRSVRAQTLYARASRQWRYNAQYTGRYSDPLQALSWFLAQHAQAEWFAYRRTNATPLRLLEHGIPNRVGKLRGFGNAIDPRPAAAFIQSVKDIIDRT